MKTVAFFSINEGVGQTSLVYHLAWMYRDLGLSVLAADLDPQASLTRMFLEDYRLGEFWPDGPGGRRTVYQALRTLLSGADNLESVHTEEVVPGLALLAGDLALSRAEASLYREWSESQERGPGALRVLSGIQHVVKEAACNVDADIVLIDVGPGLGAITRAGLFAAEHVVLVLAPEIRSFRGLTNLGPVLRSWQEEWRRVQERPASSVDQRLPPNDARVAGYVVSVPIIRLDRPIYALSHWWKSFPGEFARAVLGKSVVPEVEAEQDPYLLATVRKNFALSPLAEEARRPIFLLRLGDGATAGLMSGVTDSYWDYREIAQRIGDRCGVDMPQSQMLPGRESKSAWEIDAAITRTFMLFDAACLLAGRARVWPLPCPQAEGEYSGLSGAIMSNELGDRLAREAVRMRDGGELHKLLIDRESLREYLHLINRPIPQFLQERFDY